VPATLKWERYYSAPTLPLWIVLGLLLVVPRHNRHWQAWLILILPLAVTGFWQVIEFVIDSENLQGLPYYSLSLVVAWTSVWLVGPWLCRGGRVGTTLLAFLVILAVGVVANVGYCGWSFGSSSGLAFAGVHGVTMVVATALAGCCCRKGFRPGAYSLWLALWMLVVCGVGSLTWGGITMLCLGQLNGIGNIIPFLSQLLFAGIITGGVLYILNLPIALLCIFIPFYRERFFAMFGPMEPEPWDTLPPLSPFADRDTMEGLSQP
jgi:hypothetical protein